MERHDLIELTELGEVKVLGVYVGMNKDFAKIILQPEIRSSSVSKEDNGIYSVKYYKDEQIEVRFHYENNIITKIWISRIGTKNKKEYDNSLKYFLDRFKHLDIEYSGTVSHSKESKETKYNTGLYSITLFDAKHVVLNDGVYYLYAVDIQEKKYDDYINQKFNKEKQFKDNPLGCILLWAKIICGAILLFNIVNIFNFLSSTEIGVISLIIVFTIFIVSIAYTVVDERKSYYLYKNRRWREEAIKFIRNFKELIAKREKELNKDYTHKINLLEVKKEVYEQMVYDSLFKRSATLYADYQVLEIEAIERYLKTKKNPIKSGSSTSEILKELKRKKKEETAKYKEMVYKYEFLMNVFPELSKYVDDDELLELEEYDGVDDFKDNYDRVRDYLSEEEYRSLSEDERNQLALDNWKKRRKPSKWIAGMEYEMYCAFLKRKEGFIVVEHGIQKGFDDLGIDLIAKKDNITYIIQCKRYSNALVHENTICQLFGTTLNYKIENKTLFEDNVIPVLMTTGELSDTAKEFSRRLGVVVEYKKMGDFPMIKCNINNGNKIYHLPFDQQYKRTIIEEHKGEFYAMTVKEASTKGFRRAFRYKQLGNQQ